MVAHNIDSIQHKMIIRDGKRGASSLLLILLITTLLLLGGSGHALALDATGAASTVGRGEGEVNVFLGVETDDERWDVDNLLANTVWQKNCQTKLMLKLRTENAPDVPLPDQDTSVVDALGQSALEHLSLQPSLQEILDLEGEHVIETHAGLIEHTDAHETADEGVTLEEALGVLVVELEQLTGGTTDLGQDQGDTPDLALVAETVFTGELEHRIL